MADGQEEVLVNEPSRFDDHMSRSVLSNVHDKAIDDPEFLAIGTENLSAIEPGRIPIQCARSYILQPWFWVIHDNSPSSEDKPRSAALRNLAKVADPGGFAFVLFWVVAFGLFIALWTRKKRA